MKSFSSIVFHLVTAAVGFSAILILVGWLLQPDLSAKPKIYTAEEVKAAIANRTPTLNPDNPPVVVKEVDYRKGKKAAWYPKGESPILANLVQQEELPPVAERVGSELLVLQGVEGIGNYGGTWQYVLTDGYDQSVILYSLAATTLVRWSPEGPPIVPHIAKSFTVSPDNREFTFELRKGMKWSDGHDFTADDILYWWENECNDPDIGQLPGLMIVRGEPGTFEKLGPYKIKFKFPHPYGNFLASLASTAGIPVCSRPAHYLRQFHPRLGDQQKIQTEMDSRQLSSPLTVYQQIKLLSNPEHPRLNPWIYRTYKANPPQGYVRNPYYWAVDTEGNQLPYIDRVLCQAKTGAMITVAMTNGEGTMQNTHLDFSQYTLLMDEQEQGEYEIYHWFPATRSLFTISPNLNRYIDPERPETEWKHQLLNDKRFRQALSLAINRQDIIDAEHNGVGEPAQVSPGPDSKFYNEKLYKSFTEFDPEKANQLLDKIGLTKRDREGYRTFPNGRRMTWILTVGQIIGPANFVVKDWADVGIRAVVRLPGNRLFYMQKGSLDVDFTTFGSNSEYLPILEPRYFVPVGGESNFALGFALWYQLGGLYGDPHAKSTPGAIEPPMDHPLRRTMEIHAAAVAESDLEKQAEIFDEALEIAAENVWTISISTAFPQLCYVKNGVRNVPKVAAHAWDFMTPGNCAPETFYFDAPYDSPGAIAQMEGEIITPTLQPRQQANLDNTAETPSGIRIGPIVKYAFLILGGLFILMIAFRHPYIGRRLLLMVPMLIVISIITFFIIQLPPGDFVTSRIMQLQMLGQSANLQEIQDVKQMFYLEEPMPLRYARWMGLYWFVPQKVTVTETSPETGQIVEVTRWKAFQSSNTGLLQGNMGRSMDTLRPVNDIIGDRILLTALISLGTILFTWAMAVPIGIYSAVRQYSIGDYILTLIGFIGMCIPGFLLALLLMFFAKRYLGISISGLFSPEFAAQPEWTWAKMLDLLKHIWVPVLVMGVGGTAGMIRIMRANLLDELKKPYVTTARAKGVRPVKLLFKYPVRLALNPFISGIGGIFPALVSGGAIVAMVLSLPTVGPLLLNALQIEDMYLAGSMLMVLSLLGIIGTLVSDLLLLWLDPRIRYGGGER